MDVVIFEIKDYMVIWRQLEPREFNGVEVLIRAIVRCTGMDPKTSEPYTLDVVFTAPGSPTPQPIFDTIESKGYMFMPISDVMAFVDILRNEKPIYGHLRGDKPEWTSVTTTKEPVGEGEGPN